MTGFDVDKAWLALPALPPTTPEAWQYFFVNILHQQHLMESQD